MLSCKDTAYLISEKLDHDITLSQRLGITLHLMMCKACNRYKKQLTIIKKITAKYINAIDNNKPHFSTDVLPEDAKKRIKNILRKKQS